MGMGIYYGKYLVSYILKDSMKGFLMSLSKQYEPSAWAGLRLTIDLAALR